MQQQLSLAILVFGYFQVAADVAVGRAHIHQHRARRILPQVGRAVDKLPDQRSAVVDGVSFFDQFELEFFGQDRILGNQPQQEFVLFLIRHPHNGFLQIRVEGGHNSIE